jgi:High potential iron-sulfur protein
MNTRRQFIRIVPAVPFLGAGLLAACGEKKADAPVAAAPAPAPAPVEAAPAPAAPAAATPAPAAPVAAATGPMVDEKDATAVALGYVANASKADKAKYKQYAEGQKCSNCTLYIGAAPSEAGGCPLYPGKQVSAQGWCSSYVKKVG